MHQLLQNKLVLTEDKIIDALTIAQNLRPDRYTILKEVKMTEGKSA